jgi:hypothetical protein
LSSSKSSGWGLYAGRLSALTTLNSTCDTYRYSVDDDPRRESARAWLHGAIRVSAPRLSWLEMSVAVAVMAGSWGSWGVGEGRGRV